MPRDSNSPGRVVNMITSALGQALRMGMGKTRRPFRCAEGNQARNCENDYWTDDVLIAKGQMDLRIS